MNNVSKKLAVQLVRFYQNLFYFLWRSPFGSFVYLPCPMHPDCSTYAVQAIEKHGAARGLGMGLTRVMRCRPGVGRLVDEP